MFEIRRKVFETNSSSTHSLTMCLEDEYEAWEKGEVFLREFGSKDKKFVTKEEIIKILSTSKYYRDINFYEISDDDFNQIRLDEYFYTMNEYFDDEYLEDFEETFTTPNGDKIIAFGKYGYDG